MKGTTFSATFEIDLIPPKIMMATITATTILTICGAKPNEFSSDEAIELTCEKVPIPK